MKRRKESRIQRVAAIFLSAVLAAGMMSNAVSTTVLAQETAGQQENTDGSGTETASGDTKPEKGAETMPAEGADSAGQEETGTEKGDSAPEPEEETEPGTPGTGTEEEAEPGTPGTGAEEEAEPGTPGTGTEEEAEPEAPGTGAEEEAEPGTPGTGAGEETEPEIVSGNNAKQDPVAAPQRVMMAAGPADPIYGPGWSLVAGTLTISSDAGMTDWIEQGWSQNCSNVTSLELDPNVTAIPDGAFQQCQFTEVTIPEGVLSIGSMVFYDCGKMTKITIPGTVTTIGSSVFNLCSALQAVVIPDGVKTIESGAFDGCRALKSVTLPDTLEKIDSYAFSNCRSLETLELPEGLQTIEVQIFDDCEKLAILSIPSTVTNIGRSAFTGCTLLGSITFLGDTPPTLGSGVFGKEPETPEGILRDDRCGFVKNGTQGIHVPEGKAQAYKDAWPDWAAYIADDNPPTEAHKHNGVTFTAWTATDSLPDTAGNYYLTENVSLPETWNVPGGETSLCLNGKTIRLEDDVNDMNSRWAVLIESGQTNLYDCAGGGQITGGTNGCVGVGGVGTFYMYGGKITGSIRYGVENASAFYMYGGEISGNGGIGTYCEGDGRYGSTITVGGSAVIAGNNSDNVWVGVDSLIEIDEENPLSVPAKIGITTQTAPTAGNPVNITGENDADYSQYFQSDNPDYEIVNGDNNVVQLAVKPHTHNLTRVDAKSATCAEDGNTAYYTCDGCDQWFADEEGAQEITDKTSVVIPAAGHAFGNTEWGYKAADGHAHSCKNCDAHDEIQVHTPGDAATETTPQTCTECGYIINPAIGHTCDPRLVEKKEPDCTAAGKEAYYHCEGCDKYYEDEEGTMLIADISAWGNIAALGHDWGEWTVTKPATATKPGEKERTCKRCNEKETETVPVTGGDNKPGGGSGSGGNSGAGGSSDNSGGNSGDDGGDTGGSGSGAGDGNSAGNSGGTGAGTSKAPGTGKPKVKQEKEGNIQKEVRVEGTDTLDAAVETPLSELADMVLTKEEKQKVAGGTDVKIVLEVKDASAAVSAADKVLVEKALNGSQAKGYKLGHYLDISLYKVVGSSQNIITQTNGKVTVTIDVPDSLKNADGTKTRLFAVIRVHGGKAEFLPDLDHDVNTITIKTDRFSTYAVVYKDTADSAKGSVVRVSVEDGSKKSGGAKDNEPETGDSTPIELCATLSMIAGLTYMLLYFADRRHGMTEETKKELVYAIIAWAKQGGKIRRLVALAAIFVLLVYYHSIGKKMCGEWNGLIKV